MISPSLLYLWDKRTLYIGPIVEPLDLSQGAAAIIVALDNDMLFKTNTASKQTSCRSLLIPAGQRISIDPQGSAIAACYLDAVGEDFAGLKNTFLSHKESVRYHSCSEKTMTLAFNTLYRSQLSSIESYRFLDNFLNEHSLPTTHKVDKRVSQVVDRIKVTIDDNLSVEDLAKEVNLSVPRLVQLFKQQTGIPIRRYRLWHRLYITAIKMGRGDSLTEAAMAAGFTDSAHCTHSFRSMLGMKPSLLLTQPNKLNIILPYSSQPLLRDNKRADAISA